MSQHHWTSLVTFTMILFPGYTFVSGGLIYITSSAESPCPAAKEPALCVTLSQLATDLTEYLNDNMTMMFLQGKHSLDRKLLFVNITTVMATITAHSHSHSASEKVLIECGLQRGSFMFNNVDSVHISNLSFMGCNHKFVSVGKVMIERASFQGYKDTGSAVELLDTFSAYIQKSTFTSNTNGNYLGPIGIYMYSNHIYPDVFHNFSTYAYVGGALIVTQSNVNITKSIFVNNGAFVGGAIFSWRNSNITILSSAFSNNVATSHHSRQCFGGAVYFESDNYNKSEVSAKHESVMSIHNTTFINNRACHEGGAIVGFYSYIQITNSYCTLNIAESGGVMMVIFTIVMIEESEFESNEAIYGVGGVLASFGGTFISITNSKFILNIAGEGGAIYAERRSLFMILNSDFNNNTASDEGGTFMINYGIVNISTSRFCHSVANDGGVIGADDSIVMIHHSHFHINKGESGGGVLSTNSFSQISIEGSQFANNTATSGGVLDLQFYSNVTVFDSNFSNNTAFLGGVVMLSKRSNVIINSSQFHGNLAHQGGVLDAQLQSTVMIFDSKFCNTTSETLLLLGNCTMTIERSTFSNNEAFMGGVVTGDVFSTVIVHDSEFAHNVGHEYGSVLHTGRNSFISVLHCNFVNNSCLRSGGVMVLKNSSYAIISDSNFTGNSAQKNGGVIHVFTLSNLILQNIRASNNTASAGGVLALEADSTGSIYDSSFISNNATMGGAILVFDSDSVHISYSLFILNHAELTGIILIAGATAISTENIIFSNNSGSIYMYNSVVSFTGVISIGDNSSPYGGAITAFQSEIVINKGVVCLTQNNAKNGGAIHATESTIHLSNATVTISSSKARNNGGGLYLYQGQINCEDNSIIKVTNNTASVRGGGMHIISSSIKVYFSRDLQFPRGKIYIEGNMAEMGGGVCMEGNAKLYVLKYAFSLDKRVFLGYGFYFMENRADYGGAVYIADETNVDTCDSDYHSAVISFNNGNSSECSIQVLSLEMPGSNATNLTSITFQNNFAQRHGGTIFGGLLDRCTPSPFAEIYYKQNITLPENGVVDGVTYLQYISNIHLDTLSSQPVRLCFCDNGQQNCSYQHPGIQVKKGEAFTVTLVAVDQVNHTVPNVSIHSYLLSPESSLGEGQSQITSEYCTDLSFSITSSHTHEDIIMYAEGPCKDAYVSQSRINVQFKECICPIGFQENFIYNENCVCECDTKIFPEYISACDPKKETVTRRPKCWIGFTNDTRNSSGYLTYSYCPFDYCLPSEIEVDFNEANGPDAQCAHNRQGLLCGACKYGLSLSLGSSHCLICTNWSSKFATIVITTSLAGIGMVALILVLNLTVASGTIGGIIFYANIVNAGNNAFFTFGTPNAISVVVAWLNLDIGIDMCFFNGMDAYQKAWIELLFPTYLIFLVVLLIIISECSTRFAVLISRKNPVATLATLILLSYTKFLHTIITSLSFAIIYYPDHSYKLVWLSDATVKYLQGKHIALFLAAILIILAGAIYTSLLFSWQWLLPHQNRKLFKWTQHQKLNHFIETYNAPYTFNYRYWTGLLLLVRTILYIITSVNLSNDPAINLLAIGVIVSILLLSKICLKVYKNKWHDYLEIICFFNIILFSLASLYCLESEKNQTVIAYISGSVTLALLVIVFIYHSYKEIVCKLRNKLCRRARGYTHSSHQVDQPYIHATATDSDDDLTASVAPTSSVIDAPASQERPLTDMLKIGKVQKESHGNHDSSPDSESNIEEEQPLLH